MSTNQSMASALLMLLALLAALASPATCLELSRRAALGACGCCFAGAACSPPAYALAQLVQSPSCASPLAPIERNTLADAAFARGMSSGMGGYERAVAPIKRRLFSQLFSSLPSEDRWRTSLCMQVNQMADHLKELKDLVEQTQKQLHEQQHEQRASAPKAAAAVTVTEPTSQFL